VLTLGLSDRLKQSLATTNAIESLNQPLPAREAERETLARRSDGPALDRRSGPRSRERLPPIEGAQGAALRARDQPLGLGQSAENVA
jgi:hypothetical protein